MTTVWLLPVVTLVVAASSGGVLAEALQKYSSMHAFISSTTAVFLVVIGLSLAWMILTTYLLRLIIYGLPSGATVLSVFLPLGPTGQAGFAVLLIGQSFKSLLPFRNGSVNSDFLRSNTSGDAIYNLCVCISFLLWCIASMWIIYALLAVQEVVRGGRFPFKLPWWGLVFPHVCYVFIPIARFVIDLFIGRLCQSYHQPLNYFRFGFLPHFWCDLCNRHAYPLGLYHCKKHSGSLWSNNLWSPGRLGWSSPGKWFRSIRPESISQGLLVVSWTIQRVAQNLKFYMLTNVQCHETDNEEHSMVDDIVTGWLPVAVYSTE